MIYTLNGLGPLRGLPSLLVFDLELGEMGDLSSVDQAIERFNLTPPKRIIAIEAIGRTPARELTLLLRGLKSRSFSIYGIVHKSSAAWMNLVDGLIAVVHGGEPWIGYKAVALVQTVRSLEDLAHRTLAPDLRGIPKYLEVDPESNVPLGKVISFVYESEYSWVVRGPELDSFGVQI